MAAIDLNQVLDPAEEEEDYDEETAIWIIKEEAKPPKPTKPPVMYLLTETAHCI